MSHVKFLIALSLTLVLRIANGATDPLEDGLRNCSLQTDEHLRLSCFDALVSALPKIQAEKFGMSALVAHQLDRTAPSNEKSEPLIATISALRQQTYGNFVFTLDNGQIWEQAEPDFGAPFSIGDAVRIEHGTLSSLWLVASHHRRTRVTRIK